MKLIDISGWNTFFTEETKDSNKYDQYDTGYDDAMKRVDCLIKNQPEVDPVHAAGACYCHECRFWIQAVDYEGFGSCVVFGLFRRFNSFCSEGKESEQGT